MHTAANPITLGPNSDARRIHSATKELVTHFHHDYLSPRPNRNYTLTVVNYFVVSNAFFVLLSVNTGGCKRRTTEATPPPIPASPSVRAQEAGGPSELGSAPPSMTAIEPPASDTEFREAAHWLPRGDVAGWQQSGAVTRSSAANLFQIMDGEAPS